MTLIRRGPLRLVGVDEGPPALRKDTGILLIADRIPHQGGYELEMRRWQASVPTSSAQAMNICHPTAERGMVWVVLAPEQAPIIAAGLALAAVCVIPTAGSHKQWTERLRELGECMRIV